MTRRGPLILLILCAAGFAFGLYQLFRLRFESGDVYPEYSSLRSDPLGTMALLESLERLPGISVRRDFSASDLLPNGRETTYLHLAAQARDWEYLPEQLIKEVEGFVTSGGRLVVTFFPEPTRPRFNFVSMTPPGKKGSGPKPPANRDEYERQMGRISIQKHWGLGFDFRELQPGSGDIYQPVGVKLEADLSLPETLQWHSALIFTNLPESWQTIYARGTNAVVVERKFGAGTIVLATDSYFTSNEAILKDRQAALLAWLIGPGRRIVFDEAHFGIVDTSGVSMLVRKYRLVWLAAALLVLAGLFIWKNSLSLVPPAAEAAASGVVAGRESAAGFVNLLRRNILPRDLLNVCFAEWTKSLAKGSLHLIERVDRAQAVVEAEQARPPLQHDPVRSYREICHILKPPKS
jgi:hypothetical protein